VLDTNPGSPIHWIKQRIDSNEIHNIQFQFSDNPVIDQDVLDSLKLLTGHRYARLYLGQWCAAEGIIFDLSNCLCPHQDPPKGEYYGSIDFGFKDPFGALLGVLYNDQAGKQILYIYDERKVNEQPIVVHAQWLKANANADTIFFCDHENPEAIRELRKHDLSAQSANKNVIFGLESVQSMIAGNKLFISDRLHNLVAEASCFVYDVLTEKPAKNQDDHLSDCLRYLCATLRSSGMLEIDSAQAS
jgi:phage terminase large subunit